MEKLTKAATEMECFIAKPVRTLKRSMKYSPSWPMKQENIGKYAVVWTQLNFNINIDSFTVANTLYLMLMVRGLKVKQRETCGTSEILHYFSKKSLNL